MKKILFPLFLICFIAINAQKKPVTISTSKGKNHVIFTAKNNTDYDQKVNFIFTKIQGIYGYSSPVSVTVPAKSRKKVIRVTHNGKYSYNYSFNYKSAPTKEQIEAWNTSNEKFKFTKEDNIQKGIVVFTKDGCSRCKYALDYLKEKEIEFRYINTSEKKLNNNLMWSYLRANDESIKRVTFPTILVDSKVYHSFEDLSSFLKNLKSRK